VNVHAASPSGLARAEFSPFRPSWWSVLSFGRPWWFLGVILVVAHVVLIRVFSLPLVVLLWMGLVLVAIGLVQGVVRRCSREYTIGPDLARVRAGVFRRVDSTFPLRSVTQTTVTEGVFERLVGAGTISLGGNDGPLLRFLFVPRAAARLKVLRSAVEATRMQSGGGVPMGIPVIGLCGGIGAGKSTVARAFAAENCLVIDSDADARAALTLPHVRETLVGWWGPGVLAADGSVNRKAVAAVVFSDAAERARLEGLVHPIVKADRRRLIARAAAEGRLGVVIDAPLLFEAGSDAECDTVVFVDALRADRVARVMANRGWSEEELVRREAAQLPLEEKRRRSMHVIDNHGSVQAVNVQVRALLETLARRAAGERGSAGVPGR